MSVEKLQELQKFCRIPVTRLADELNWQIQNGVLHFLWFKRVCHKLEVTHQFANA
jgi:hypothetical protein